MFFFVAVILNDGRLLSFFDNFCANMTAPLLKRRISLSSIFEEGWSIPRNCRYGIERAVASM